MAVLGKEGFYCSIVANITSVAMETVYPPDIQNGESFTSLMMGQNHERLFADLPSAKNKSREGTCGK